jgi:signal transduction histidine kinase
MKKVLEIQRQLSGWKWLPLAVIGLTLGVLGAAILLASLNLRQATREQIASRDGESLQAVSLMQQYDDAANDELLGSLEDPGGQFSHVLKISRLKGVLGIRLFKPDGEFVNAFPENITESALAPDDLVKLRALKPVSHFDPRASLESLDMFALAAESPRPVPLLEVNVPLQNKGQDRLLGVAQFILDGGSIAREYAALDHNLVLQGLKQFFAGGVILALAQWLAFRRVQRAHRLLSAQTRRLLRANQELTLAAKTSAVGAVTSHLIHGLKNPLSGLQGFVNGHLDGRGTETEADWLDAVATTRRMQALISGVVRVLEEQQAVGSYEISLRELGEIISSRMLPVARATGVHFYRQTPAEGVLGNREANLVILILENLIQNAFQATPEGKSVRLIIASEAGKIRCDVQDEGAGFPEELRPDLFSPCRSPKPGGSGIGLAISRQLAMNIGARLELLDSSSAGCTFCLWLPQKTPLPITVPVEFLPDRH